MLAGLAVVVAAGAGVVAVEHLAIAFGTFEFAVRNQSVAIVDVAVEVIAVS